MVKIRYAPKLEFINLTNKIVTQDVERTLASIDQDILKAEQLGPIEELSPDEKMKHYSDFIYEWNMKRQIVVLPFEEKLNLQRLQREERRTENKKIISEKEIKKKELHHKHRNKNRKQQSTLFK